jgi:hypothetical protein
MYRINKALYVYGCINGIARLNPETNENPSIQNAKKQKNFFEYST